MVRPYDGRTYHYRDDDGAPEGLAIVCRVLGLASAPDDVRYDIELYSGGIGVIDRLAISFPATPARVGAIVMKLSGGLRDDEELRWLLDVEEGPIGPAAIAFVNENRRDFQAPCTDATELWFAPESGVNHWEVVWVVDGVLSYLAYDQG